VLFNREGGYLPGKLRCGCVHSTEVREKLLLRGIERQQQQGKEVIFCADVASEAGDLQGPGRGGNADVALLECVRFLTI
jgi:hypothetical protein